MLHPDSGTLTSAEYRVYSRTGVLPERCRGARKTGQKCPTPAVAAPVEVYRPGRMNGLETAYSKVLEARRLAGDIRSWRFEAMTLRLADRTRLTPDFLVILPSGAHQFHETKGRWREDARVKIKVAAEQYPEYSFFGVRRIKGEWEFEPFGRGGQ
jgi:hypothetical protein